MKSEDLKVVLAVILAIPLFVVLCSVVSLRAGGNGLDFPLVLLVFFMLAEGVFGLANIKVSQTTLLVSILFFVSILVIGMVLSKTWNLSEVMPMRYYVAVGEVGIVRLVLFTISLIIDRIKHNKN